MAINLAIKTPIDFAESLLTYLGIPVTDNAVALFVGWESAEGGNWHNNAAFNPLNTTLRIYGSTSINSVGVQAYGSWAGGIIATAATLAASRYNQVKADLRTPTSMEKFAYDVHASGWGTQNWAPGYDPNQKEPIVKPTIVAILAHSSIGFWIVTSDGGVYSFGNAPFYGAMAGKALNAPIVGASASPTGAGYWLVGGDGGLFAFGDALSVDTLSMLKPVLS